MQIALRRRLRLALPLAANICGGTPGCGLPRLAPDDYRRLGMALYGVTPCGFALCCDATLVSPSVPRMSRDGQLQGRPTGQSATPPGPRRRSRGRWRAGALNLVQDLVRLHRLRAPPVLHNTAAAAWARRWTRLSLAVPRAMALSAAATQSHHWTGCWRSLPLRP